MKKRIVSIFLTLCTLICLVPTAVLAADEVSAKVNGIAVPAAGGLCAVTPRFARSRPISSLFSPLPIELRLRF